MYFHRPALVAAACLGLSHAFAEPEAEASDAYDLVARDAAALDSEAGLVDLLRRDIEDLLLEPRDAEARRYNRRPSGRPNHGPNRRPNRRPNRQPNRQPTTRKPRPGVPGLSVSLPGVTLPGMPAPTPEQAETTSAEPAGLGRRDVDDMLLEPRDAEAMRFSGRPGRYPSRHPNRHGQLRPRPRNRKPRHGFPPRPRKSRPGMNMPEMPAQPTPGATEATPAALPAEPAGPQRRDVEDMLLEPRDADARRGRRNRYRQRQRKFRKFSRPGMSMPSMPTPDASGAPAGAEAPAGAGAEAPAAAPAAAEAS